MDDASEKVALLSGAPLFDMLSNTELGCVAELAQPRHYAPGQIIFAEGESGDSLFVIGQGEVEVLRHDAQGVEHPLAVLGPPQCFGEMSLIDKEYRSATVRARVDCDLLHLSAEQLTTFRQRHRDGFTFVVINIARMLSHRLREANAR
jgi:CRP-like cAMP-binding protein